MTFMRIGADFADIGLETKIKEHNDHHHHSFMKYNYGEYCQAKKKLCKKSKV